MSGKRRWWLVGQRRFADRRKGAPKRTGQWATYRWGGIRTALRRAQRRAARVVQSRPALRQRWTGRRRWRRLATRIFYWAFAGVLTVLAVVTILSLANGDKREPLTSLGNRCTSTGYGCTVFNQLLFTAAPLALGFIVFLAWRYRRIPAGYLRQARESPTELVETAGSIFGEVVGREDLCDVLQTELRDERVRRPHVLVGGLGIGKTAVLVKLTNVLARRGAVPVPVRLRDAADDIDFLALARDRFLAVVGKDLRSAEEGDRIWKQLVKDDRIIVLADGLEEAFADEEAGRARHHRVRVAVHRAHERKYSLIIASRPHEALRALDAALVHVEPLNNGAALDYIQAEAPAADYSFEQLIEVADVTETPLYLQIARELHDEDLLEEAIEKHLQTDRVTMRYLLLDAWVEALVAKKLNRTERVPLDEAQRRAAIDHLTALACVGLREDTQQLLFDEWEPRHLDTHPEVISSDAHTDGAAVGNDAKETHHRKLRDALKEEVRRRIQQSHDDQTNKGTRVERGAPVVEMQAAASKGIRLGLVEPLTNGVRFPHSIVQAFLGARMFESVFTNAGLKQEYIRFALEKAGRELLLALVFYSRMVPEREDPPGAWLTSLLFIRDELVAAAHDPGFPDSPSRENESEPEEAHADKGEVAFDERRLDVDKRLDVLAAAVEIDAECGMHGRPRATLYTDTMSRWARSWDKILIDDDTTQAAKLRLILRLGEAARRLAQVEGGQAFGRRVYRCLYEIARAEGSYRLRLAAAQEIGNGSDVAWQELSDKDNDVLNPDPPVQDWTKWNDKLEGDDGELMQRECDLKGWLLPMLLGSVTDAARPEVEGRLKQWIRQLARGMPLSLEAALAQGFKHAANRRPHHSHEKSESRTLLQAHATHMIYHARFWYSRLTLVHALTLWELARIVYPGHMGHESSQRPSDARSIVTRWLRRPHSEQEKHPFVLEAAELARRALETKQPARFIWIDESGVVTKVGSQAEREEAHGTAAGLWISASAGWMALDGRAQQLVGDVLILLNLAERGEGAQQRDDRLDQANADRLPLCLTEQRCPYLKPSQTVGRADIPNPGEDCKARCPVALCPYPPRGQQAYRVELSEAFCRRQQVGLLRWRLLRLDVVLRPRPWQQGPRAELRRFWSEMEERARKS